MSGYHEFSKSNNGLDAEADGLYPASVVARKIGRGATAAGVRAVLKPSEWHHTSKAYNETQYYMLPDPDEDEDAEATIAKIIEASRPTAQAPETYEHCVVEWTEFSGSPSSRWKSSTRYREENCRVEVRGVWAYVTLPSGKTMRKKVNGNWFSFSPGPQAERTPEGAP